MSRDYSRFLKAEGVYIPRWLAVTLVVLLMLWFALRILIPPSWIVQRLDSPDGRYSAQLMRNQYLKQNFSVHVKSGWLWRTAYYSAPITNNYRVDLGERLVWSADSQRLFLEVQGRRVWGFDFAAGRDLGPDALQEMGE